MKEAFGKPVGYSDHTTWHEVAWAAVALGACVIEKHFTLDRTLPGPDHQSSLQPQELVTLIRGIRIVESALGDGRKLPTASELEIARVARKSLVAARDIPAGCVLTEDMIAIKRPGTGLPPEMRERLVGRTVAQSVPEGALLTFSMVA
jgi:sialic acid synthase SpsE